MASVTLDVMAKDGAVPFADTPVSGGITKDPELTAPDLAGLNPDIATMRRSIAAFRPYLEGMMRQRYGIEVLAIYVYPAQVVFCKKPFSGIKGLAGLRVRTSGPAQSDWIEALGGKPVTTGFGDIIPYLDRDELDCAITGTMSGNTVGLDKVTTHVHPMAISWGLSGSLSGRADRVSTRVTVTQPLPRAHLKGA